METIGITGGTGFVGSYVAALLVDKGYKVVIFTRQPSGKPSATTTYALLDAEHAKCDIDALKRVSALIHLAGAGIADKRWSKERKKEIVESRVNGTRFLVSQLKAHAPDCKTLIAASAIGYYGPDRNGEIPFTETSPGYPDFLGETCAKWEAESEKAADQLRTVILRFGVVLGKESGAFPKFTKPVSLGIMPILGSGRQVASWVSIDDLSRMIVFALETMQITGIYNAVAPYPVTYKELTKTIARVKGGIKIPIPVPAFLLKILLGEMSEEILKSCTVSSEKIEAAGFSFQQPTIDDAVKTILKITRS